MKNIDNNDSNSSENLQLHPGANSEARTETGYRAPRVVEIGKADGLVRNSGTGHLRDGSYGWWVWGS